MNIEQSRIDLIIRMQPFSIALKQWCREHLEFLDGLKIINPSRFLTLQAVITSRSPLFPDDEVIGVWVLDYGNGHEIFKEDYIINKNAAGQEFHLYTRHRSSAAGKYVHDIKDFFRLYGGGGQFYVNSHHATYDDLPTDLKPRADRVLTLARGLRSTGLRQLSKNEIKALSHELDKARL